MFHQFVIAKYSTYTEARNTCKPQSKVTTTPATLSAVNEKANNVSMFNTKRVIKQITTATPEPNTNQSNFLFSNIFPQIKHGNNNLYWC